MLISSSGWQWKGTWSDDTRQLSVYKCQLLPEVLSNCLSLHHTDLQSVWNHLALVFLCVETSNTSIGSERFYRAKEISEDSSFVKKDEQWLDSHVDSLLFWYEMSYFIQQFNKTLILINLHLASYTSSIFSSVKIVPNKASACYVSHSNTVVVFCSCLNKVFIFLWIGYMKDSITCSWRDTFFFLNEWVEWMIKWLSYEDHLLVLFLN